MTNVIGGTLREWLSTPVQTLLEMARHQEVSKEKIAFDEDDIAYLHQFPRRHWVRALRLRYGELLIQALMDRDRRRRPEYDRIFKKHYTEQFEKKMQEMGASKYPKDTEEYHKLEMKARQEASSVAHRDTEAEVEKIPGLQEIDPKFETGTFEFEENTGRDKQGGQRRVSIHVPNTGIGRLVHRLETTPGHNYLGGHKPGEDPNTLVGKLGYYLWHARQGNGHLPSHTGGMLTMNNDVTAGRKISDWINAVASGILGHDDKDTTDHYKANPDKFTFDVDKGGMHDMHVHEERPDSDAVKNSGAKETHPYDTIYEPIADYFYKLLRTYRKNPDDPNMKAVRDVIAGLPELGQSTQAERWKSDDSALRSYSTALAKGYLWLKAKEVHPGEEDQEYENSTGAKDGHLRLLTRVTDTDHRGLPRTRGVYLWKKSDGSIDAVHPDLHSWKQKHTINYVETNPRTGERKVVPKQETHPILKAGKSMIPLPMWLWKKTPDMQQYHGMFEAPAMQPAANDPSGAKVEWRDDEFWNLIDEAEQAGAPKKGGRPKAEDKKISDEDIRRHMGGHVPALAEAGNRFPWDRNHVKRLNNEDMIRVYDKDGQNEIAQYPTFGRYGNYIESKSETEITKEVYSKALGEQQAARLEDKAKDAVYEKRRQGDQREAIPTEEEMFISLARKELDALNLLSSTDKQVKYHYDFFHQRTNNELIAGGHAPNSMQKGMKPLPRGSDEWKEEWRKLTEDPDSAMTIAHDGQRAWVFPQQPDLDPQSDGPVFVPVWQGVALGLRKAVSMYHRRVAGELAANANELYQNGLHWLQLNLGDPKIRDAKNLQERNKYIKFKVAQLVAEAGQQDIAGVGTRRTVGKNGAGSISMDDQVGGDGDGAGASMADILRSQMRKSTDFRDEIKRSRSDRAVRKGAFDTNSLLQTIHQLSDKIDAHKDLDLINDPLRFSDEMRSLYAEKRHLHKLLIEKYMTMNKPDGNPYSEEEARKAAAEEWHKIVTKGRPTNDKKSSPYEYENAESPADMGVDDEISDGAEEHDPHAKMLKALMPVFSDPKELKKWLKDEKFLAHVMEKFERNGDQDAWEDFQKLTQGNQESLALLAPLRVQAQKQTGGEDLNDAREFKRGAGVQFYPGDSHEQKYKLAKLLVRPTDNRDQLDKEDLLSSPEMIPAIDKKTLEILYQPDSTSYQSDLDTLQFLRGRAAAQQISTTLKPGQNAADFIVPMNVEPRVVARWLKEPVKFEKLLSQPSVLAVAGVDDLIAQRLAAVRAGGVNADNKDEIKLLVNLDKQAAKAAAKSATNLKTSDSGSADTSKAVTDKEVQAMLDNPLDERNKRILLNNLQARTVQNAVPMARTALTKWATHQDDNAGEAKKVVADFLKLALQGQKNAEEHPVAATGVVGGGKFNRDYYKPVPAKNGDEPFQVVGNPKWSPAEMNQIMHNDPDLKDPNRRDEIAIGIVNSLPNPPAVADFGHDDGLDNWGLSKWKKVGGNKVSVMPQINLKDIERFKSWLDKANIKYEERQVSPTEVVPSQHKEDMNDETVLKSMLGQFEDKPAIVVYDPSSKYVAVDGHHRWAGMYGRWLRYKVPVQMPVLLIRSDFKSVYNLIKNHWQAGMTGGDQVPNAPQGFTAGAEKAYPGQPGAAGAAPTPAATAAAPTPAAVPTAQAGPSLDDMLNDPAKHKDTLLAHPMKVGDEAYQKAKAARTTHKAAKSWDHVDVLNNLFDKVHGQ